MGDLRASLPPLCGTLPAGPKSSLLACVNPSVAEPGSDVDRFAADNGLRSESLQIVPRTDTLKRHSNIQDEGGRRCSADKRLQESSELAEILGRQTAILKLRIRASSER